MKALVTGATGFVGGKLVTRLLEKGWKVKAFVRRGSNFSKFSKEKNLKIVFGDVSDFDSLEKAVVGVDVVFSCAAALPYHNLIQKEYWEVNVKGIRNLMAACLAGKIKKVVYLSTVGIYGTTSRKGKSEKSEYKVTNVYSKTKYEGEKIVWEYIKKGLPVVIIKPTIAYGPTDTRPVFLNLFLMVKKGIFPLVGKGDNFFHTIYIDNLIDSLLLAATKKSAMGEDFIIGDDPCPTMRLIVKTISEIQGKKVWTFSLPRWLAYPAGIFFDLLQFTGLPAPLTTRRVDFMTQNKRFIIDKAKKVLGYSPKIGLGEGLRRTLKWYKENGYL